MDGGNNGFVKEKGTPHPDNIPFSNYIHAAVIDENDGSLLVFGGKIVLPNLNGNLYIFLLFQPS